MIVIRLLMTGKHKEPWVEAAYLEFKKRMSRTILLEEIWLKDERTLFARIEEEREVVLLDPKGKQLDSLKFASFVQQKGARLAFAIGGPYGFSDEFRQKYPLLSLSTLTFSHQITRLVLLEQLFRTHEIWRNSPYPK